ncbi:DUF4198 domain-containing protein [bacterium]|nr:DUF4198 domain-containing protein [bacterium]
MSQMNGAHYGAQASTLLFLLFLTIFLTSSLFAHDMYLAPRFDKKIPNQVSLAMFVEKEEVVWFESMTDNLRMDGPTGEANLNVPETGDPIVEFPGKGTYTIGWQQEPTFIQIEPEIFKKYITVEGFPDVAVMRKKSGTENKPGREIYTRYVKTFIQVGSTPTDDFERPLGYKIEILPQQNPCGLSVDSDLDVIVLFDGKPLVNQRVKATYDSYSTLPEEYAQETRTDENGMAKFRITHKGRWLIRATKMLPLEKNPEAEWQSFWANFTFEVN